LNFTSLKSVAPKLVYVVNSDWTTPITLVCGANWIKQSNKRE
jgi:hypothetical protein